MQTEKLTVPLGELIEVLYEAFLEEFGDEEVAATATAATLNRWLQSPGHPELHAA